MTADIPEFARQSGFDVRVGWGTHGLAALRDACGVLIVVDVLSYTTSVEICVARGAIVHPLPLRDTTGAELARCVGGVLAGANERGWSLKPSTLEDIDAGVRIVMPSPNGSRLSTLCGAVPTLAGCLRNASAVATRAVEMGETIGIVAAGEEWPDRSLRPAFEDQCGAGAIVASLPATLSRSPEAASAAAVFADARASLFGRLLECASGREKQSRDLVRDVELAAALDVSRTVPGRVEGAFRAT